ncbi:hypothetical protein B0H13DRAFT_2317803 [Mycena leptocephala]|nr:hypothetical protein B0H13DRAFT_2317803 [Mycena leptocephala]
MVSMSGKDAQPRRKMPLRDQRYAVPEMKDALKMKDAQDEVEGEIACEPEDDGGHYADAAYASDATEATECEAEGDELSPNDAWVAAWTQGPRVDEDRLIWLDAMEDWSERIEADRTMNQHVDSELQDAAQLDELVPSACWMGPEPRQPQASYNRAEIPENEREEYTRVLTDLGACELEDQRARAEGYVWNEELGEYLHPDDLHPSFVEVDLAHSPFEHGDVDVEMQERLADIYHPRTQTRVGGLHIGNDNATLHPTSSHLARWPDHPPVAAEGLHEATKISLVAIAVDLPMQHIPSDPKTADSVAAQPLGLQYQGPHPP